MRVIYKQTDAAAHPLFKRTDAERSSEQNRKGSPSAHSVRSGVLPRKEIATTGSEQPSGPMSCVVSYCFLRLIVVPLSWAQLEARRGGKTARRGGKRGLEGGIGKRAVS